MIPLGPEFLDRPFAHRGYHDVTRGVPENSRAAFEAAIVHGYGIELDLQRSSDDRAMVFHDYDMARLTGTPGKVNAKTASDLAAIQLSGGSEGIPTLEQILNLVDGRAPLLIEIKDQDGGMGPNVGPLEQATAKAISSYSGPLALMSFNPHSIAVLADLAPDIPRGLVTDSYKFLSWPELTSQTRRRLRTIPDYDRVGASFISHQASDLQSRHVKNLKAKGANILCWTVRNPNQEAAARKVADNITFESYKALI